MPKAVRIGDEGVGVCSHPEHVVPIPMTGHVTTGATNTEFESKNVARVGDVVTGLCGHTGTINSGSTFLVEGQGAARIGDTFIGFFSGTLTTGADNTTIE